MKKFLKVMLVILVVVGLFLGTIFFILGRQSTVENVDLGENTIPTLYSVVGKRKVIQTATGIKSGVSYKTMTYEAEAVNTDDLQEYVDELQKQGYFITQNEGNVVQLGKEASEDGDIVLITITKNDDSTVTINYAKGEGTITEI